MPERFEIEFDRAFDPLRVVGLFNFADETRDLALPLPPGRWHAFELWEERYRGVVEGAVEFALVSPHACRVVALRPAPAERPRVVGSTAHIGCGALDITTRAGTRHPATSRSTLSPSGRRRAVCFVAGGKDAASARRRVRGGRFGHGDVALVRIRCAHSTAMILEWAFRRFIRGINQCLKQRHVDFLWAPMS